MKNSTVSIIIPVYNEAKYIDGCLSSLLDQSYPIASTEWLLIDGGSTDDTVRLAQVYADRVNMRILPNERRLVTYALNIGIEHAVGDYVIRVDAHAQYDRRYIEKCIETLETTGADNVGGIAQTKATGYVGVANAQILSSRFGVGNSQFRTGTQSGYVDTVPFGAFRREIFKKVGYFDPTLPRSEDNDFNSRIRSMGGKIYLSSEIRFTYYCRDTFAGLLTQGIKNGNALFLTIRKNPKAMSVRHYVPFAFVLSLIILPIMITFVPSAMWLLWAEIVAYFALDFRYSFDGEWKYAPYKLAAYPLFHIAYGIGSLLGLVGLKLY